ncbi:MULTISPECIES: ABC transporter ATP-binding protein [Metabacillus]|uniref:Multidrug ABC transporter ATP-binding protein n=2 Tax=Metabacillus TaxID=2675233 RepID=A0A179SNX6_9BACI|nr:MULTISPECIES: ABC transporter ATP-binding protein [Metabacillus]OAS82629.1 multidrug ABC transporter ATP-binding protein [Metabacillus litoralis]QNF30812.1 ABC transporter ATP-binding protein [Metabacillus sp. KUDC1714]
MLEMIKHLKPYKTQLFLVFLFSLVAILFELYLPTLMADIVDVGIVNEDVPFILKTGGWMLVCTIMSILLMVGVSYFASKVSLGFGRDMRRKLFVHIEHFSLQEYEKFGSASLITRTTNDVKVVQDVINMMQRMMTRAPLMLVGGVLLAVSRDRYLSLVFLAALPILALVIFIVARKAIPLFSVQQKKTDRLTLILREVLTGIRVVRAFNRVEFERSRFNVANEEFRDTGIKVGKLMALMFPIMLIIMNFTNIAIVWFGAIRIDQGDMQVGNLLAFIQYAAMILFSLIMLSMAFIMIPRAQVSAKRLNDVLLTKPMIKDPEQAVQSSDAEGIIEFKDVTFRYEGAEKPVLEGVSFSAKPGETTAIIGSTGAGKSTLLQLIPRFYDVESGSILIDGVNIQSMTQSALREKIGYVPQKATLFSGTIAENIRYGKEDATEADIVGALETAQATQFVQSREHGIESNLEQAGVNLSGGQKQRLSIARALVRKPKIYLFDDSFSALDYKTDSMLRQALKTETSHATIIIVAQRVNTVKDANKIIVLNEGEIAGVGTHQELLHENAIYQEIVASQENGEASA